MKKRTRRRVTPTRLLTAGLALAVVLALAWMAHHPARGSGGMENFTVRQFDAGFADVATDAWYYDAVQTAAGCGLLRESGDGRFRPEEMLTAAEAVAMAASVRQVYAGGGDKLAGGEPWYQPYVDYALARGILTNAAFDSYTRPVTRAEMADLFARALPEKAYTPINSPDDDCPPDGAQHRYAESIRRLYRAGILTGSDVYGAFDPDQPVKRCEAAAALERLIRPDARRQVTWLRRAVFDGQVTVAVPQGVTRTANQTEDGLEVQWDGGAVCVRRHRGAASDAPGMTILDVPEARLTGDLPAGMEDVTVESAAFGDIPCVRLDFRLTDGGGGSRYAFLLEGDLYTVTLFVLDDGQGALLADLTNHVTVGDCLPDSTRTAF